MKNLYAALALLGTLLPYSALGPWLAAHGLALAGFWSAATENPIALFAWLDVLLSGAALLVFIFTEGRRIGMGRLWLPATALFVVGVSLALPLFLWLREHHLDTTLEEIP